MLDNPIDSVIIFRAYKLFVVFNRPRDLVSRLGGWVLVGMATVFEAFQWGLSAAIRALPLLVAAAVMRSYVVARLCWAHLLFNPRRLFVNRGLWVGFWAGPFAATLYALYLLARTVYDPGHLTGLTPPWVLTAFGVQSLVSVGNASGALSPTGHRNIADPAESAAQRVLRFAARLHGHVARDAV